MSREGECLSGSARGSGGIFESPVSEKGRQHARLTQSSLASFVATLQHQQHQQQQAAADYFYGQARVEPCTALWGALDSPRTNSAVPSPEVNREDTQINPAVVLPHLHLVPTYRLYVVKHSTALSRVIFDCVGAEHLCLPSRPCRFVRTHRWYSSPSWLCGRCALL